MTSACMLATCEALSIRSGLNVPCAKNTSFSSFNFKKKPFAVILNNSFFSLTYSFITDDFRYVSISSNKNEQLKARKKQYVLNELLVP